VPLRRRPLCTFSASISSSRHRLGKTYYMACFLTRAVLAGSKVGGPNKNLHAYRLHVKCAQYDNKKKKKKKKQA